MNLLDEEKNEFENEPEKEPARERFDHRDRFGAAPESSSPRYEMDPLSDYGAPANKIIDDPDYKKSSKGPLFLLLFAIIACAFVAWYFLVGPGEKKAETSSIKTLFDQPIVTADSTEMETDTTGLELDTLPETDLQPEPVKDTYPSTSPYTTGAGRREGSIQSFVDLFSATLQALPAGSHPSVLTFNKSGYLLSEVFAGSRADLADFKSRFESASASVKLKALSEDQVNFAGQPFYRGVYSGEVNLKAGARTGAGLTGLGIADLKAKLRQVFTNSGMRVSNVEDSRGKSSTIVFVRSTGTRATATKALSALAQANLNALINKANIKFDTTEPVNDFVVAAIWLEVIEP